VKTAEKLKVSSLAVSVAGALLFAMPGQAAQLEAKFNSLVGGGSNIPAGFLNATALNTGSSAGLFLFTPTAGGVPAGVQLIDDSSAPVGNFLGICLEPTETISFGQTVKWDYVTTDKAPVDSNNSGEVPMGKLGEGDRHLDLARLLNGVFPTWDSAALIDSQTATPDLRLALQLAVWEIANEEKTNGYKLDAGIFRLTVTDTVITTAQGWLDKVGKPGGFNNSDNTFYRALTLDGTQDFVIKVFKDGDTTVPIPAAAWLLGSGLLGLFGLSRRRQKTTEA
jgi:hypothetical protein